MTMKTGKLSKWYKSEGDPVEEGGDLFEVETEKITDKIEAPAGGSSFDRGSGRRGGAGRDYSGCNRGAGRDTRKGRSGCTDGEVELRQAAAAAASKAEAKKQTQPHGDPGNSTLE